MSEVEIAPEQSTELIPSISIINLLKRRKEILDCYDQIQALAVELKSMYFPSISHPDIQWKYSGNYGNDFAGSYKERHREEFVKIIDKMGWQQLMIESGNLTLMDAEAKEQWQKTLDNYEAPELTYDNIKATFTELHAKRGDMFDRGVVRCFQKLSWDYKMNNPVKFGKRIKLKYFSGYYSSNGAAQLDDLIRVFRIMDKKPEIADYSQTIQAQASTHGKRYPFIIENEYVHVRLWKNNHADVTFKDMQLVDELNRIVFRCFPAHIPHDEYAAKKKAQQEAKEAALRKTQEESEQAA